MNQVDIQGDNEEDFVDYSGGFAAGVPCSYAVWVLPVGEIRRYGGVCVSCV